MYRCRYIPVGTWMDIRLNAMKCENPESSFVLYPFYQMEQNFTSVRLIYPHTVYI